MQIISFITQIPDWKHYRRIEGTETWPYQWVDKASDRVRIVSADFNISKDIVVHPRLERSRSRGIAREKEVFYYSRLKLCCFPLDKNNEKLPRVKTIREIWKDKIGLTLEPTLAPSGAIPHNDSLEQFVFYSFVPVSLSDWEIAFKLMFIS